MDATFYPGGTRSLTSIAVQSFCLGLCFGISLTTVVFHTQIWRLPTFLSLLCVFHFLEFFNTARYNTIAVKASSFLLFSNGIAYNTAHSLAMLEILLRSNFSLPRLLPYPAATGMIGGILVLVGQSVRSMAMAQAGTNFNHMPAKERKEGHVLVTNGVYRLLRHPAYFGFFYWAIGTQLLVGNEVCLLGYIVVLWRFFSKRIRGKSFISFLRWGLIERFRGRGVTGVLFRDRLCQL
ncbi:ICMT-domain-containing protein [Piedraia hortae CBS 480.64]|uniref:Protein-S-isoprenylcysteine O-methyltransferase n=1 Tax=Piedraia hortae CBS 480.64 TaxID=1314780 RepID=A0A6A7C4T4_9PEZI|nr:ICMT-domain-containing protein [Piedraia hortae CBS 480.64]